MKTFNGDIFVELFALNTGGRMQVSTRPGLLYHWICFIFLLLCFVAENLGKVLTYVKLPQIQNQIKVVKSKEGIFPQC